MDDECRHEPSIPVTAISSTSGFSTCVSTCVSTPALGSDIPVPINRPTTSGDDSFAAGILSQLDIPTHMADRNDQGLHVAYKKDKAYLEACHVYERKVADGSWTASKLTRSDLI